ncbi:MAG: 3-dehydroquinate synthase [Bacteroidota bacterium]
MSTNSIVRVPLGNRSYPIYIGSGLLTTAGTIFRKHNISRSVVIITDQTVASRYLPLVRKSLLSKKFSVHTIILPSGEGQKSLGTAKRIYSELLERNMERSSTIVALGGGVIGDLAGFIAATYQRGIGFVQIPTTLLAQVDSSVGGKVGINHPLAKNMIGAFYQPKFVLADTSVLATLPKREMISGLGEVVKYGIILDKKFFSFVEKNLEKALSRDQSVLAKMIRRSCALKSSVVARDEKEDHLRAILNFGHTIGHALEQAGKFGILKHGEAILYGMVAEAYIACAMGMLSIQELERIEFMVNRLPIPFLTSLKLNSSALLATMRKDKKTKNGVLRMPLPNSIGKVSVATTVDEPSVLRAIEYLRVYGS